MSKFKVVITDYAWPDLEIERRILAEVGAKLAASERQDASSLAAIAADADAIMTTWAQTPESVIAAAPRCRIVARIGVGLDNIDVDYCTKCGIPVTNVPDYCSTEVAEHALALLFSLARKVAYYHHATKSGRYELQAGALLRRIEGRTLGIIGFGAIGRKLAEKALALGMEVLAADPNRDAPVSGVEFCELDQLLSRSDYVSLHAPLALETRHMISSRELAMMKPSAYLLNTARGGLVDHSALAASLAQGRLAGTALDVQETEPPDLSEPPYNDPRVIVTPHAAFMSVESLEELRRGASRQVAVRLAGGQPENVVNGVTCG